MATKSPLRTIAGIVGMVVIGVMSITGVVDAKTAVMVITGVLAALGLYEVGVNVKSN